MSESTVFVVYNEGPDSQTTPYGVFSSEDSAEKARESIIKRLEDLHDDSATEDLAQLFAGTLEERISIRERQLRSEFHKGDLDELFEDVTE